VGLLVFGDRSLGTAFQVRHNLGMSTWTDQLTAFRSLARRRRQPELMDQPEIEAATHAHALSGLARVNWFSRSAAIFWPALRRLAREQQPRPLRVLDIACGGGDVTVSLAKRARRAGVAIQMAGCDMSGTALEIARRRAAEAGDAVEFFRHDVLQQPLPARFDVVMCSLFLHHLDEADAVAVLRSMVASAGRAVLINDLIRSRSGYLLACFGARLLTRSHVVHVDGPLSVAGAFTPCEVLQLCEQAGLTGSTLTRHWPQRFLLTWRKP